MTSHLCVNALCMCSVYALAEGDGFQFFSSSASNDDYDGEQEALCASLYSPERCTRMTSQDLKFPWGAASKPP